MGVVSGGWTVDARYVEYLDQTGLVFEIYKNMVKHMLKIKLATIEGSSTLTPAEESLADSGDYGIERCMDFIKLDPKYSARGFYMPSADIASCLDSQWANILKKWN